MRRLVTISLITALLIAIISATPIEPDNNPMNINRKIDRTEPYRPSEITRTDLGPLARQLDLSEYPRTRQWRIRNSYANKQGELLAELREQYPHDWPPDEAIEQKQRELRQHYEEETAIAKRNQKYRGRRESRQQLQARIRVKQKELNIANEKTRKFEQRSKGWAQKAAEIAMHVKDLEERLERLHNPGGRQNKEAVEEEEEGVEGDIRNRNRATGVPKRGGSGNKNNYFSSLESLPFNQQAGRLIGDRVDSLMQTAGKALQHQNQFTPQAPSVNAPGPFLTPSRMPAGGILAY